MIPPAILAALYPQHQRTPPSPGWWLLRVASRGPAVPAAIMWVHTTHEPDDEENIMERSPHLTAFIAGEPMTLERVWEAVKEPIEQWRYEYEMAVLAHARRWLIGHPLAAPRRAVDWKKLPPIGPET